MPFADAVHNRHWTQDSAYELHGRLRLRPSKNVPDPRFCVPSAKHERVMERMPYGIHARKGIVMMTGGIGSGKTLLRRAVILKLAQHPIDYLDRAETKAYILTRLAAAGGEWPIFSPSAISSVYHRTGGVCRLINSFCDLCLYFGCVSGAHQIRRSLVEKVADEALHRRTHDNTEVMS